MIDCSFSQGTRYPLSSTSYPNLGLKPPVYLFSLIILCLVAQALNTSPEIVKSNYLNYSDEWARNRFRVLGYDKRALPQSSMKSKNKVSGK